MYYQQNLKIVALTIILITGFIGWLVFHNYFSAPAGMVIILNGPSASGKSSIQKEFQSLMMPDLWIKLGIDNLFDKPLPDITAENLAFWQSKNSIRWVESHRDNEDKSVIPLYVGEQGDCVAYGMNSAIAVYAKNGNNIIVDYIAYKKEWLNDLKAKLKGLRILWVKIDISLESLEEREAARATSPVGHARSHYSTVHWDIDYDFVANTAKYKASEIAQQLKDVINGDISKK